MALSTTITPRKLCTQRNSFIYTILNGNNTKIFKITINLVLNDKTSPKDRLDNYINHVFRIVARRRDRGEY